MKKDIHLKKNYIEVSCTTCNKKHLFASTDKEMSVDICSNCHSFYTGVKNSQSAAGRVERFNKRIKKLQDSTK